MVTPTKETEIMNKPIVSFKSFSKGMHDLLPLLSETFLHFFTVPSKAFYGYNTLRRGETKQHTRGSSL